MNYPIQLRFKKITLTNEMRVIDGAGQDIAYVRQKLLKLKEEVIVFSDRSKSTELYKIKADKIIDWSPTYTIYDPSGNALASTKRNGAKSLFNATYELNVGDKLIGTLKEHNPWVKFLDAILGEIPILGLVFGYFINPKYDIFSPDGTIIANFVKRPAVFEGYYTIENIALNKMDEKEQSLTVLLLMMIGALERERG